jgi:hypothetical protein
MGPAPDGPVLSPLGMFFVSPLFCVYAQFTFIR